jgi:hypothetical protein
LKTTVSPLIGVRISKEDILTRVMDGLKPPPFAGPAGTGQQSFLQEFKAAALTLQLFQIMESVSQTVVSTAAGVDSVTLPPSGRCP